MKKKSRAKIFALGTAGALITGMLSGCTFGFASDPDDPNETEKEIPIDTSKQYNVAAGDPLGAAFRLYDSDICGRFYGT